MKKLLFALLGAAVAFAGCVMTPEAPVDRRVTIDESIGNDVYITDIRCTKGTGNCYTLQAKVVNNTSHDYPVEWKVVWLDADGMAIDTIVSTWQQRMLNAKDIVALQATAPGGSAVDMRLYIRRLR